VLSLLVMLASRAVARVVSTAFAALSIASLPRCSLGDVVGSYERDCGVGYHNVGDNQCDSNGGPGEGPPYEPYDARAYPYSSDASDSGTDVEASIDAPIDDAPPDVTDDTLDDVEVPPDATGDGM